MATIFNNRNFIGRAFSKEKCCPAALFFFGVAVCSSSPAFCGTTLDTNIDAQMNDAFQAGLEEFESGKNDISLEIARVGHHWLLTGYDRTGASVRQLSCLLCTQQEAVSTAAFLGSSIGRHIRADPAPPASTDPMATTVSIDGIPVPKVRPSQAFAGRFLAPVPAGRSARIRWAAVAAGLGLSAAITGSVFLWMDGKCAASDCSASHVLKGTGIGLIVSGALLETAAIVLWRVKRKSKSEDR